MTLRRHRAFALFAAMSLCAAQAAPSVDATLAPATALDAAVAHYAKHRTLFAPGPLQLDFRDNLATFGDASDLEASRTAGVALRELLDEASSAPPSVAYHVLAFELSLHEQRIAQLVAYGAPQHNADMTRISDLEHGRDWYAWLLQRWTGTRLTPAAVMAMGEQRVATISARLALLRDAIADAEQAVIEDRAALQALFEARAATVAHNLGRLFPEAYLSPLRIAPGDSEALAQTPGYYSPGTATFHYNLFDRPYLRQNIDWLLLHEGVPGHHFQLTVESRLDLPEFRFAMPSAGYREGWAAYVEEYGEALGLYATALDRFGMLQWKIVRAVRTVLDVGLNHEGWTEERALAYWKQHIPDQDAIALREIRRMQRWPAQVQTYTVGAMLLAELRDAQMAALGDHFDLARFHRAVLEVGPVPLAVLADVVALSGN